MSSIDVSLVQKGRKHDEIKCYGSPIFYEVCLFFGSWLPAKNFYVLVTSEENFILLLLLAGAEDAEVYDLEILLMLILS